MDFGGNVLKILFVSLGCDKNLCDSEAMLGLLTENGFEITNDEKDADIIVINTCSFIHDAKEESITTILEMANLKEDGKLKALIVSGCLAQRYKDDIMKEIPEVDAVVGTTAYDEIVNAVKCALEGKNEIFIKDNNYLPDMNEQRVITTGGITSYIKIAEGCDKRCTYCIIPKLRGSYRSVPMEKIIAQADYLAGQGVKELVLVAQETTVYGKDIYGEKMLPQLLRKLCKVNGIEWIRILYCYPEEITDELIKVMKEEDKICNYLDMPIQHSSDNILKRMGRRTTRDELTTLISKLRKEIPDIILRTTLITGFPGETSEDFEDLLDFVYDTSFNRLGVFTYSPEEDTPAYSMENQIDEEIKEERKNQVMQMQQDIAFDFTASLVGKVFNVLIEGYIPEDDVYVGRTYMDAPGVDGYVFVKAPMELLSGQFVDVEITEASGYDLVGKLAYVVDK